MKHLSELFQEIKHSNPLKESNEAKLLCNNAFYKYREKSEAWKQRQAKNY